MNNVSSFVYVFCYRFMKIDTFHIVVPLEDRLVSRQRLFWLTVTAQATATGEHNSGSNSTEIKVKVQVVKSNEFNSHGIKSPH